MQATEAALIGCKNNEASPEIPSPAARASRRDTVLAGLPPVAGADFEAPILNVKAFKYVAGFVAPQKLRDYLRTVAKRADAMLHELRKPDALPAAGPELAISAHALAGSAVMFGFERLAAVALSFERAAQSGAADMPVLADVLCSTAEITLVEIRGLLVDEVAP